VQDVFAALERGATLLTAGTRLARVLHRQYGDFQQQKSRPVWQTPDILPLDAWLRRAWRESIADGKERRILLSAAQEAALWEAIVESHHGEDLLRIPETAEAAARAWQLAQAYRIPLDGSMRASDDCLAFLSWATEFRSRCDAAAWLESAQLADLPMDRPAKAFLAGFDSLTPQQTALFDTFPDCTQIAFPRRKAEVSCFSYPDSRSEIRAAAAAAREWLAADPNAQIGIVVPDMGGMRSELERVFRETLGVASAVHVSLGRPLDEHPVTSAGLLLLEFAYDALLLSRAGSVLRSPFTAGAAGEASARALLDAKLRRRGLWHVSLDQLRGESDSCPRLQTRLHAVQKLADTLPARETPSAWSRWFWQILEAFGWPGERTLDSREHQTVEAFKGLLGSFAALDLILDDLSYQSALLRLRRLARETLFQVENQGAPVQIMGELEASGVEFDHLWVLGLHDEAWPRPVRPNPFLPLALQRQMQMPRSSAAVELAYSKNVLSRLCASAPEVILSYPKMEGERELKATPLVERRRWQSPALALVSFTPSAVLEALMDETGPKLASSLIQSGGTRVFFDMAACPFRAFAIHRLGAREMEESEFGLAPRRKGTVVHRAMETLWAELGSQARLRELSDEERQEVVSRNVDAALTHCNIGAGRKVEQARLQRVLGNWLQCEAKRWPFRVLEREEGRNVDVGPLTIGIRADRVDVLDDGRLVILDYKTGEIKNGSWTAERMKEPQVPLYCITSEVEVAVAALVQLSAGEPKILGLGPNGIIPDLKQMSGGDGEIKDQIPAWRDALEALALRFQAGEAAVDPEDKACEYCKLPGLCRIQEVCDAG
jgi:ATP-dependent helicase/nuclease subunit B